MPTEFKKSTAEKSTLDKVKTFLESQGVNTTNLSIGVISSGDKIIGIKLGNSLKDVTLTAAQISAIKAQFPDCDSHQVT